MSTAKCSRKPAGDDSSDGGAMVNIQPDSDLVILIPGGKPITGEQHYFGEGMDADGERFTVLSAPSRFTGKPIPGSMGRDLDLKKDVMFVELCDFKTGFDRCLDYALHRKYNMYQNFGDRIFAPKYWNISVDNPGQQAPSSTDRWDIVEQALNSLTESMEEIYERLIEIENSQIRVENMLKQRHPQ